MSFPDSQRTSSRDNPASGLLTPAGGRSADDVVPSEALVTRMLRIAITTAATAALGAAGGAVLALLLLLVGAMRMLIGILMGVHVVLTDFGFALYYIGGFVAGGTAAGALWSVRRWIGGAYGLGVVMAGLVMTAIGRGINGPFSGWDEADWIITIGLSLLFGLVAGYAARHDVSH